MAQNKIKYTRLQQWHDNLARKDAEEQAQIRNEAVAKPEEVTLPPYAEDILKADETCEWSNRAEEAETNTLNQRCARNARGLRCLRVGW